MLNLKHLFIFLLLLVFPVLFLQAASIEEELQQGRSFLIESKFTEAETLLQSVTTSMPEHGLAWLLFGTTKSYLGKFGEALTCYSNSIEISPTSDAFYGIYTIALIQSNDALALSTASDWLRHSPENPYLRQALWLPPSIPYLNVMPSLSYAVSSSSTSALIWELLTSLAVTDFLKTRLTFQQTLATTNAFKTTSYQINTIILGLTGLFDLKNSLSLDAQYVFGNDSYSDKALTFRVAYHFTSPVSFSSSVAVMPFPSHTATQLSAGIGFTFLNYFLLQANSYGELVSYKNVTDPSLFAALDPSLTFNLWPVSLGLGTRLGTLYTPFLDSGLILTTLQLKTGLYAWASVNMNSAFSLLFAYSYDQWFNSSVSNNSSTSQFKLSLNLRIP